MFVHASCPLPCGAGEGWGGGNTTATTAKLTHLPNSPHEPP